MTAEDKWRANLEKVAFIKKFPGLLGDWPSLKGRTVQEVIALTGKQGAVAIVFTDATVAVAPPMSAEPYELGQALAVARPYLERTHQAAYVEYDRLVQQDRDALKAARLENILGAIRNNVDQIPELKDRLKALVKEWP
ncbi:MAG TPA: hypothetical protein VFS39_00630 [Nitrospira sp.]|nr:hypothetical protein [Nitrospira sp.]